ncbi:pentapeptide repeat-containing protein [Cyanobium sp. Morenito 9A2]|uniref:pentapeptide repeat-containing protein n=1 Tax=Cyanobium sp. Morenito 9A2 TaxID=2823718 RepID=UPI0020CE44CD|nr:pentapeptide repeat-containing protein [Cyanobium sp. Morenito 9A2]MCP9850014.1 pentapeptide repeat-containing protein [Cyanobium sp. Morenito 9A2]
MSKVLPLISLTLVGGLAAGPGQAADQTQLIRLLESRSCVGCKLQDADLVQADLRDGDLRKAKLQRANLSGARLDGAKLGGADLSYTSLAGASLRGADLRGALLQGTDLRSSDLSDALFDPDALARTHWEKAVGVSSASQSYAALHNAGADSAIQGRYPEAERFFGDAIRKQPDAALSWVARGISRVELGKNELAAQDFAYAATLYEQAGDKEPAEQLKKASAELLNGKKGGKGGNGLGSQLLGGAMAAFQFIAPLAVKAMGAI